MCALFTLLAYISRIAAMTVGSVSTFTACSGPRKMKCSENTPDSGWIVDEFAVETRTKSMSPVCTFCSVCASEPSCAPGYWLVESVPLLSSESRLSNTSATLATFSACPVAQGSVPVIRSDSAPDLLTLPADIRLGEVTGVAVNSKGHVFVLSRGNTSGPAYGAAACQLLEFDADGKFVRE